MLRPGDTAPDFTLEDENGSPIRLADYRGKSPVVLMFYPADNTPGCTHQLCTARDDYDRYEAAGAAVFGVNPGSAAAHRSFRRAPRLPHAPARRPRRRRRARLRRALPDPARYPRQPHRRRHREGRRGELLRARHAFDGPHPVRRHGRNGPGIGVAAGFVHCPGPACHVCRDRNSSTAALYAGAFPACMA